MHYKFQSICTLYAYSNIKYYDKCTSIYKPWNIMFGMFIQLHFDWHSQIGWRSILTLNICTANHSREQFYFAFIDHRPSIDWQSDDSRVYFWVGRPSADDRRTVPYRFVYMYTYHTPRTVCKRCSFLDGHGSFARVIKLCTVASP